MAVTRELIEGADPVLIHAPDQAHPPSRIVIYIHGYAIDWHQGPAPAPELAIKHYVDYIDRFHHLGPQVHHACENGTLVIIPESPKGGSDMVRWTSWSSLRAHIAKHSKVKLGDRTTPITMIGHSGAYRTQYYWRREPQVDDMCLIDGLYGFGDEFLDWLEVGKRKLTLVVSPNGAPRLNSERLVARSKVKARIREPWDTTEELSMTDLDAPLLFWRTNLQHMELVKSGKIIPQILRRTS